MELIDDKDEILFVSDDGMIFFASPAQASSYMEPQDINNNVYPVGFSISNNDELKVRVHDGRVNIYETGRLLSDCDKYSIIHDAFKGRSEEIIKILEENGVAGVVAHLKDVARVDF